MSLPQTIDEFVLGIFDLYGHNDEGRKEEELWLQVVEESSRIAESVRENSYENILKNSVDLLAWLAGFVAKCHSKDSICHFDDELSMIIHTKFPGICSRCEHNPCQCLSRMKELQARDQETKKIAYARSEEKANNTMESRPQKLDEIVAIFYGIFSNNLMIMNIQEIAFHLLEEVGEVSVELRQLRARNGNGKESEINEIKKELKKEIADVFSWVLALIIKVNLLGKNSFEVTKALIEVINENTLNLETINIENSLLRKLILKYYSDNQNLVCPTCKETKCDLSKHTNRYKVVKVKDKQ